MGKKVKTKNGKEFSDIGKKIVDLWLDAAANGQTSLSKDDVAAAFNTLLENTNENDKQQVVYDFIFDQVIDDDTRMVWINIPVPDGKKSDGKKNGWKKYAEKFKADADANMTMYEELGKAALFGCGR